MIDLTPLDVRNKRGDFKKLLRGYDPQEVDTFLELVAERLEEVVRENIQLRERSESLHQQVSSQTGREKAVQEALVTAQELRADIKGAAQKQADLILQEAEAEGRRRRAEAEAEVRSLIRDTERQLEQARDALNEMERRRSRFLKGFRQLLEREMDVVEIEEGRAPLDERPIEIEFGGGQPDTSEAEKEADGDEPVGDPGGDVAGEAAPGVGFSGEEALFPPADADEGTPMGVADAEADRDLFSLPEDDAADGGEDGRWG